MMFLFSFFIVRLTIYHASVLETAPISKNVIQVGLYAA